MAGTVATVDLLRFKRIVFRATKGNSWTVSCAIVNKRTNLEISTDRLDERSIFLIFFQGGQHDTVR